MSCVADAARSASRSRAEVAEAAEVARGRAFATAGLRPATRTWRDPHIQAAVNGAPFVCADLSTSCRAQRDVTNARLSASSEFSARDPLFPACGAATALVRWSRTDVTK